MIPKETIDEIFNASIIEDVIGEFVTLKKRGANYLGNCPFHNEKTPSFTVSPAKGIYKCFGCGKAGNSVNFIMEHEHYSYPEALRFLANKYNIEIEEEEQTDEQIQTANEKESLYIVSNFAANYFVDQLHNSDRGKAIALSYFTERGFTEATINKFQLGYNPDEWTAFTNEAENSGYDIKYLEKTGLTIVKEDKKFDRFKGRVMFPIHNLSGRVLGFGGRILSSNDKKAAKYVNSPESEIYSKSNVLYGIYFAKKSITQENNCYLVEGYTDVISLSQASIENVVASSGTSLTEGQIKLIKRYTPNITILYDGDAAGLKASFRGIDMILKEEMNVRIVLFPEGEDPDSFAKKSSTEELKNYITDNAEDFIQFKTHVLLKEAGNDPIKKAELIKDIVESISIIPDQIKRAIYTKECSTLLEIPEQALINETNKFLRKKVATRHNLPDQLADEIFHPILEEKKGSGNEALEYWESEIIRLLITYALQPIKTKVISSENKEIEKDISVATYIIHSINNDEITFVNPIFQRIFNLYAEGIKENNGPTQQEITQHSDNEISQVAINLLSNKYELSSNWAKMHKTFVVTEDQQLGMAVINSVSAFKLCKIDHVLLNMQQLLKEAENDDEITKILEDLMRFQKIKSLISEKLGRVILK
ncbi:MAG: DNA primase [Bacteroidetes bacterium HGW-Bacteroidetes-12]|nr:MAG: DNA primase [Bacteroidetes bacterium HGW-Bacteroidetes-12]